MAVGPMEIAIVDTAQGKDFASRNFNDFQQTLQQDWSTDRGQVDWLVTLRQRTRGLRKSKYPPSVPEFSESRKKPEQTTPPEEGPYLSRWKTSTQLLPAEEQTNEKYQNYAETKHMLVSAATQRQSSGTCDTINWQLNLRDSTHAKPDRKWKRYFQRSHQSFDLAPTNFAKYENSQNSPDQKVLDRSQSALLIATVRDMPINMVRWPGCEGTALHSWEHLSVDRRHGHKTRNNLAWETRLREKTGYLENLGSKTFDNRSEGCVAEMLGKKKTHFGNPAPNDLALPYAQGGDPKLYHIRPSLGEPDEEALRLRQKKTQSRRNYQTRTEDVHHNRLRVRQETSPDQ